MAWPHTELLSVNMSLANGDAEARWHLFGDVCERLEDKPDVIAFQEVAWDPGKKMLEVIRDRLGSAYKISTAPVYEGKEDEKGSAVITRTPIKSEGIVQLPGYQYAQVLRLGYRGGGDFALANVHYEAHPWFSKLRVEKSVELTEHLREDFRDMPHVIAGDLNVLPDWAPVRELRERGFRSAYQEANGQEPDHTYPTNLTKEEILEGGYSKPYEFYFLRAAGKILKYSRQLSEDQISPSGLIRYPVDFIMVNGRVPVVSSGLLHDGSNGHRPFSDHFGLRASLDLT